jgi:uncharacterized protein
MCIVTRAEASEDALVRFARAPDGTVVPDLLAKLPGRGVWVSCSRVALAEAIKRKAFTRGFEEESQAPEGLADTVLKLLRQQAVNQLSLARKAGAAVQGFTKVEEALRKGHVGLLLHVQGASADGSAKLDRLKAVKTTVSDSFRSDELDLAFGRENVVHAAVAAGGLAEKLALLIKRMDGFEGQDGQSAKGSEEET